MAYIKRLVGLCLCIALFCLLTACALIDALPVFEAKPAHNTIAPKIQQAQMIDPGKEIILYQSMFSGDRSAGFTA